MAEKKTQKPTADEIVIPDDAQRESGPDSFADADDNVPQTPEVIQ